MAVEGGASYPPASTSTRTVFKRKTATYCSRRNMWSWSCRT